MKNKKNLLVTLADKNYINQAKQLFSSAYWNGRWDGDYMLLSQNIPEKDLKWFRDKGILIYQCKPLTQKGWKLWSNVILDKFYLFTPEFKKWKHIVYLDGDIIVKRDLKKLTRLKGFWAVIDYLWGLYGGVKHKKIFLKEGYNLYEKYFNSGVFAFSTDIIKKNTFNDLNHLWDKYKKECKFPDQTILNLYFQKKWKELDITYNLCPVDYYRNKIIRDPSSAIILHFWVPKKPWGNKKRHFYSEWKNSFDKADEIDLKHRKKISRKGVSLNMQKFLDNLNRELGKTGMIIKKKSPKLYYKLGGKN
jgi:lipopolysaccharide biosynthesis glycosyltransferase